MRNLWKALIAAVAFALGALLVWELWLKQVWEALALPRLHHYWYGILLMLGAFALHLRRVDKHVLIFLSTMGLILFGDDLPDFISHFGVLLTCIMIVLLVSMLILMFRKDRAKSLGSNRRRKK